MNSADRQDFQFWYRAHLGLGVAILLPFLVYSFAPRFGFFALIYSAVVLGAYLWAIFRRISREGR